MADVYDVWSHNLDQAFSIIANIDERYTFMSIDTEFPGIILSAPDCNLSPSLMNYLQLRENVNSLKIIQLGLSFADENGEKPKIHTIQFNFQFNLWQDPCALDALELLKHAGLDFQRHATEGIDVRDFGERLIASGLVLNEDVRWISFHGMYDFAYLLQLLTQTRLPETPAGFFEALADYFPRLTDLKYCLRSAFRGGLQALANSVGAYRRGSQHQGGSDALLTLDTYFRLHHTGSGKKLSFDNCLFGLNSEDAFWFESNAALEPRPLVDFRLWTYGNTFCFPEAGYQDHVLRSPETVSTVDTDRESQPLYDSAGSNCNIEQDQEW